MKPFASLSLDLDNIWSYLKIHGNYNWRKYQTYFDIFIPDFVNLLDEHNLRITFFIVGRDVQDSNIDYIKLINEKNHDIANHSFNHEPWLHTYPEEKIKREILETEERIVKITGKKVIGFRSPGFCFSSKIIKVLIENNYLYDASILPTYIGPFARSYYFLRSDLTREEKNKRNILFGRFKDGLMSIKPYYYVLGYHKKILEIPITTIPLLKLPFHLSYLIYLSRFSIKLMRTYLKTAILLCKIMKVEPSFLLHPLDLLGRDQVPELIFFPGMDIEKTKKQLLFKMVIEELKKHFKIVDMNTHFSSLMKKNHLPLRHLI